MKLMNKDGAVHSGALSRTDSRAGGSVVCRGKAVHDGAAKTIQPDGCRRRCRSCWASAGGGNSAAEKHAAGDHFRSVEVMMANHNAAANSSSLKFAREPFSSEHIAREL